MSAVLPSIIKIECPLCSGEIKFPKEQFGQLAACPHCAEEIVFEPGAPASGYAATARFTSPSAPASMQRVQADTANQLIAVSYLLAILIPIVGFIMGIVLLAKNQVGPGIGCLLTSAVCGLLWLIFIGQL